MEAYSTLVSVDVEAAVKLSAFIAELCPEESKEQYFNECSSLIEAARSYELLMKFLDKSSAVLASESDVDAVFQGIVSILFTIENVEQSGKIIERLVNEITSSVDNSRHRLRVLISLLNLFIAPSDKFSALQAILSYALVSKQEAAISHLSSSIEQWAIDWKLSSGQKQLVFDGMAKVLVGAGAKHSSNSLRFALRAMQENAAPSAAAVSDIIAGALRLSPSDAALRLDVVNAVSRLNVDVKVSPLLQLLKCVSEGDLAAYKSLAVDSLLSSVGVSAVSVKRTVLLMSLCNAVASQGKGAACVVSYATAAAALELSGNDDQQVESWIVDAVGAGVLDCSLNQIERCINVTRYLQPNFGKKQWQELADQLTVWKTSALAVQAALSRQEGI